MSSSWADLTRTKDGPLVPGPVLLVVMDGVGRGAKDHGDAVHHAHTPTLDWLAKNAPTSLLKAHGPAVGLPSEKDMGNSEVGHNALGAGRVFDQGAKRVAEDVQSGAVFERKPWQELVRHCVQSEEAMHFIGLLSDGNVHSHVDHLFAMLRRAKQDGVRHGRVHVLLDGRDVPERSALEYIAPLEILLNELCDADHDYRIASGGGRMHITMDRYEADWEMVERGWRHHVKGEGRGFDSATQAIEILRAENPGISDQNLPAFVVVRNDQPVGPIRDGASVVFFNFRGDRAIQISRAFTERDFNAFARAPFPEVLYAGMMQYDGDEKIPERFLVKPPNIDRTLGEYLARNQFHQFACSETQKFGHVTFFWNGNRSGAFDESQEQYVEVPSDRIPFDQKPKMKAKEITDATLEALASERFAHLRINYANGDMVGHTGNFDAAVQAVQTVDAQVKRLMPAIRELNGALLVTADHGNADEMFIKDANGDVVRDNHGAPEPKTSHTLNPVPCHIYAPGSAPFVAERRGSLSQCAATVLALMGLQAPPDYDPSLIEKS